MEQALLIVWRESIEALLVIGLLHAWLRRQHDGHRHFHLLWLGVLGGGALAALLAALMILAGNWMSGPAGEWFQAAMSALASVLILQMVMWMRHNGRQLRGSLESRAEHALTQGRRSGLMLLAAIAVAREGSEIAIFLYGAAGAASASSMLLGAGLGVLLGALSFALLQAGSHLLDWRRFFAISELLMISLGGAMLMNALDRATGQWMGMDLPERFYGWLGDPLWDSSAWLDDGSRLGGMIAGLTGYRAMPSLVAVLTLAGFWLLAYRWRRAARQPAEETPRSAA
ncbi:MULTISPECIES: FTR1 family protein [unclassified Pseudomonas]|uniref:FTR1 family iron permease n=1 Tax=unclassified Pseudomonas TaxID=196821 RepID=UPI00244C407B|nr:MULTISPECIES: FTR1 family protein [unclassified Pseudomonas]MDH0895323.1 FTR1 family protein [Pseudomonas sp. GD03875]MDH1064117.1 FTR1 family protein [Pseudomonas sp. GD03985]